MTGVFFAKSLFYLMAIYAVNDKFAVFTKKCYNSVTIVFLIASRILLYFFADRMMDAFFYNRF
ncbi:hypothetical protein D1B31_21170 [Neobacillus notoginsengisoli]|uniref:Uncharacterized protein n=1 Tax=Neobacillus notoginsengisoli TaxID=1578198 RepID=A0A417YHP7_9BACI|nr:hypothetical protein D1B31_21170 [Neobacillus notoginsengisoli]